MPSVFKRINDEVSYALSFNYVAHLEFGNTDYALYITQINLPTINTSPLEIQAGGYKLKYPSAPEFGELSFQCYCDYDEALMDYLYTWQTNLYSHTGVGKVWDGKDATKFNSSAIVNDGRTTNNIRIDLYSPYDTIDPNADGIKAHWIFYGAWPSSINYGERNYTGYEAMQLDITLTFQYCNFKLGK